MAALGSQSIASSYEQLLQVDRDGGGNGTTHVSVKDGDNGTTFGFTIATDALMMSSTNRLEFGDTGTYIHQSADGVLDLVSDTEIEINATTIDMNGALDLSGNAQLSGTVTVGADGSGTDVIFYSGTAGDNFTWDASDEKLTITGTNGQTALDVADGNLVVADNIDCEGDIDINGTSNLDAVDIDGAVQIDSTVTVGADDQGYDVIFYGDTASSNMTWDTSGDDLILNDARLFLDMDENTYALEIDHEGTSYAAFKVSSANTTGSVIDATSIDSLTTGGIADFHSNSDDTGTRSLVKITNDNASATGATALTIQQDAAVQGVVIDQNGNNQALKIDTEATTNHGIYFDTPATTTGHVLSIIDANSLTTGKIAYFYSNSSDTNTRNLVDIINENDSAVATTALSLRNDANSHTMKIADTHASRTAVSLYISATRSSNSGIEYIKCYSGGTSNVEHLMDGAGQTYNESGTYGNLADYAEYFESTDGKAISPGTTVVLEGSKVKAASEGETPIGVVRPNATSSIVGNAAWNHWQGRYLRDDYGEVTMEEYTVTEWMEDTDEVKHEAVLYEEGDELPEGKKVGDEKEATKYVHEDIQYQTDKIPSNVTVPDDAIVTSKDEDGNPLTRRKENPDYDSSASYKQRRDRDEWNVIGLLGQIQVTKGQPTSSNWIKMKDVSDTVEMYFVK